MGIPRRRVAGASALAALGLGGVGLLTAERSGSAESAESDAASALVAGSLLAVADAVPGASVEAHGSVAVRRFVRDGLRDPDVVAVADPTLLAGIVERAVLFATNALVVAYDPDSDHADELETDWASAVADSDVSVGRTDPDVDPLGYRTVMALELAAREGVVADSEAVLSNALTFQETGLMRALESSGLDAAFVYRNMAAERGLPFVDLPARIDFSDPSLADRYASVTYDLSDGTVRGAPIRYAAAPLTERGQSWCSALVGGGRRLREHGFGRPEAYPKTVRIGSE